MTTRLRPLAAAALSLGLRCGLLVGLLGGLLGGAGCHRYHTRVPGVIDLRTDASMAQKASPEPVRDPALAREDAMGLLLGQGVGVLGSDVRVVERRYSLRGLIPLVNESAAAEIDAGVRLSGALREVTLHEEHSLLDWVIGFVGGNLPLLDWVLPPYTFELRGVSVRPPLQAVSPPLPEAPAGPAPPTLLDEGAHEGLELDRLPEEERP